MKHEFCAHFLNDYAKGTKVNELLGYAYIFDCREGKIR
jgi:hypothetical protein